MMTRRLLLLVLACFGCSVSCSSLDDVAVDAGADLSTVIVDPPSDAALPVDLAGPIDFGTINTCTDDCPDLVLDQQLLASQVVIEWRAFPDPTTIPQGMPHVGADCSVAEHTVGAPGVRRLLRFSTGVTNVGAGDLLLGDPSDPAKAHFFEYAPCHGHYHFSGFANYRLLAADNSIALDGHKQAFCIEDNIDKLGVDPDPALPTTCSSPGLHRGWSDVYYNHTEANWIDITGLAAGTYTLVVTLNDQRAIAESDYTNNAGQVQVTIVDDPTPKICPSDTEALFRCSGAGNNMMTRCYAGIRDTETCINGTMCTQPLEISHQSHCGVGGAGSISKACPSNISSTPFCDMVLDPMTGTMKSVRKWCVNGIIETEYCGTACVVTAGSAVCQ